MAEWDKKTRELRKKSCYGSGKRVIEARRQAFMTTTTMR